MTKDNFEKAENALLKAIDEISTKENATLYSDKLNATVSTLIQLEINKRSIVIVGNDLLIETANTMGNNPCNAPGTNVLAPNNTAIGCREN
jgi:hypothetical protein